MNLESYKMFNSFSQFDEAVPSENLDRSVNREQQGLNDELNKALQNEDFWCLLKKNLLSIDKCFSFLRGTSSISSENRNCFQQHNKHLPRNSLVESCPSTSRATAVSSPAISRVNFTPPTQKLNLNNFLMFLLCACIPVGSNVPPPTKIMVCLPCPPPIMGSSSPYGSNNRNKFLPFCVPAKLEVCNSQTPKKGKYLPPPAKRQCSPGCLHVCDLKTVRPCMADQGSPCVAHCFESKPKYPY